MKWFSFHLKVSPLIVSLGRHRGGRGQAGTLGGRQGRALQRDIYYDYYLLEHQWGRKGYKNESILCYSLLQNQYNSIDPSIVPIILQSPIIGNIIGINYIYIILTLLVEEWANVSDGVERRYTWQGLRIFKEKIWIGSYKLSGIFMERLPEWASHQQPSTLKVIKSYIQVKRATKN